MAYCGPAGIPLAVFMDDWDQLSRDAALAWQLERDTACSQCGQHRDEWMTVGEDGKPREVRPPPYVVEDFHCPSCEAMSRARKAVSDSDDERHGVYPHFVRRPDPPDPASDDGTEN